jgi:UDP-glucuronate 4-epimerase
MNTGSILLTGGAGFIGSHLAERLIESGREVVIIDNLNTFYDPRIKEHNLEGIRAKGDFTFYREDFTNQEALRSIYERHRPETVIHLGAYAGVRPSLERPVLYHHVNVMGTLFLLELMREFGGAHLVFASSSSVYGINSKVPFSEDDPLHQPVSPYASTKRAGELLCHVYHHNYGIPITCLRFFTVYGPRQRPEMGMHKFLRMLWQDEEIPLYDNGRSARDYTYVDDIIQGILAAADKPAGFRIFNLGNSKPVVLLEVIRQLETILGKKARTRLMPAQPGDVPITFANIDRAQKELGYKPTVGLAEGLARMAKWYEREIRNLQYA